MSTYITGQSFIESVDGNRSLFTMQRPIIPGTLKVFQDGSEILSSAFREVSTAQVRFIDPATTTTWTQSVASTIDSVGHSVVLNDPIVVWSSGELPGDLGEPTVYYARDIVADAFGLAATVGGAALTFADDGTGTYQYALADPPLVADGDLSYNAVLLEETVDPNEVIGFWVVSDFQEQYSPSASLTLCENVLADAADRVENYVMAAYWALAETQVSPYRTFRRVIGELAFFYLASRPGVIQNVTKSTKSYGDNTKKMEQQYSVTASSLLTKTENDILSQLSEYTEVDVPAATETSPTALTAWWGTGRDFGMTQEDDLSQFGDT